jgi:hypothetical protein
MLEISRRILFQKELELLENLSLDSEKIRHRIVLELYENKIYYSDEEQISIFTTFKQIFEDLEKEDEKMEFIESLKLYQFIPENLKEYINSIN